MMERMDELKYPIGRFKLEGPVTAEQRRQWIEEIAALPAQVREAVAGLSSSQLDTPYRPGGWTIRQVIHHLADSHLNSYIRYRLALTEEQPTIKAYKEDRWAELADAKEAPVELSLTLLDSMHQRWVLLMQAMGEADWKRAFVHPERGVMTLETNLALYAWHGKHHLAHIQRAPLHQAQNAV
jgi:hypothetical protein